MIFGRIRVKVCPEVASKVMFNPFTPERRFLHERPSSDRFEEIREPKSPSRSAAAAGDGGSSAKTGTASRLLERNLRAAVEADL